MRLWQLLVCAATMAQAAPFVPQPFHPKPVTAKVPWYTVPADLGRISNHKQLPKLTAGQRAALTANAFVARPTREEQLFYLYETNNYQNVPSFVTTDLVLHTYHVYYDFLLRALETKKLNAAAQDLTGKLLAASLSAAGGEHPALVAEALQRNIAFFGVPAFLYGDRTKLPPKAQALVDVELSRIDAHQRRETCFAGSELDYTQLAPRGHYTRSDLLKTYFRAVGWYGQVSFELKDDTQLVEALILAQQLGTVAGAKELWDTIYEPTSFFVGTADDVTWTALAALTTKVFGSGPVDRFADPAKLRAFRELAAKELPAARIEQEMLVNGVEQIQGRQFRFMGQRHIPDSRMLQELSYPKVGTLEAPREIPQALDVMAVLGSSRAVELLDKVFEQTKYANYAKQRDKLTHEFGTLKAADWSQNLYFGWLAALRPLLRTRPEGYPAFGRNVAWRDKSLLTALGSWTELRHDTLLYGKQAVAEAGGDEPPPPPGYIEPEPEVYERLAWLLNTTREGLLARGLIEKDDDTTTSLTYFAEICGKLGVAARKELATTALSVDELADIKWIGSTLEGIMLQAARLDDPEKVPRRWWNIENKTDRSMAVVADVHTSKGRALQEAVGEAAELWVIVPFKGRLVAARGAMFTWTEFIQPANDRLTDEKWQAQLKEGRAPAPAAWVQKVIQAPGLTKPTAYETLGE